MHHWKKKKKKKHQGQVSTLKELAVSWNKADRKQMRKNCKESWYLCGKYVCLHVHAFICLHIESLEGHAGRVATSRED